MVFLLAYGIINAIPLGRNADALETFLLFLGHFMAGRIQFILFDPAALLARLFVRGDQQRSVQRNTAGNHTRIIFKRQVGITVAQVITPEKAFAGRIVPVAPAREDCTLFVFPPGVFIGIVRGQVHDVLRAKVFQVKGNAVIAVIVMVGVHLLCGTQQVFMHAISQLIRTVHRVIPGAVHLVPVPVQLDHVPRMADIFTGYQHTSDTQLAQGKGIRFGVTVTDGRPFQQGAAQVVVVLHIITKVFPVIGNVLHQPFMHIEHLFQIRLAQGVGLVHQLVQLYLHGGNILRRAVFKADCNRQPGISAIIAGQFADGLAAFHTRIQVSQGGKHQIFIQVQVFDIYFLCCFRMVLYGIGHALHHGLRRLNVVVILRQRCRLRSQCFTGSYDVFQRAFHFHHAAVRRFRGLGPNRKRSGAHHGRRQNKGQNPFIFFHFFLPGIQSKNVFAAVYPNFKFYTKQRRNTMPDAPTSCTEKVFRLYIF